MEENLFSGLRRRPDPSIADYIYARFPRLKERRQQSAGTLSGGEQQILALGRCLMRSPKLILLDEPTEGIMPKIVNEIRHEIAQIAKRGISVLLVEQNLRTALRLASRIYLMENGAIVHEATPDNLRPTRRPFTAIWASRSERKANMRMKSASTVPTAGVFWPTPSPAVLRPGLRTWD